MTTMRSLSSMLLAALLLNSPLALAGKAVPVIPLKGAPVTVRVGGKGKTYYMLTSQVPVRVEIDGPGKLVTQTRLMFPSVSGGTERYSVSIGEGGKRLKTHNTQTEKSRASIASTEGNLGRVRKTTLKVPAGTHTYEFCLENTLGDGAVIRFSFTPEKGKRSLVSLEALSYNKIVTALVKEKLITYYVSAKEQQVHLRVIGPTKVKVTARLNYDASMKGAQRYGLGVWEGTKRVAMKALATTKSVGIEYREWKDVVPGKSNPFYLDIPSGEHRYIFKLEEGLARSVSLKFSIPKSDLQNEE